MKRVQLEIVLGTLLGSLSVAMVIILGAQEPQRLAEYTVQQRAEVIEFGATVFTTNCTACHGSQGQGLAGVAPSLRDEHFFTGRLDEIGWQGGLEDYIISIVTTGRQVSTRPGLYAGSTGPPPGTPTWSGDGVATRAATRVAGLTAEEYIRQSILDPNAYVVEGFADENGESVMPNNFGETLSEEQISDLAAFLLTL